MLFSFLIGQNVWHFVGGGFDRISCLLFSCLKETAVLALCLILRGKAVLLCNLLTGKLSEVFSIHFHSNFSISVKSTLV